MKAWLVALAFLLLLLGCTSAPECPPCGQNETAPIHAPQEVAEAMSRYLTEYYGLWSNQPDTPIYEEGVWSSKVTIYADSGGIMTLDVYFSDADLRIEKMTQRIILLEEKKGIVAIPGKMSCSDERISVVEFGSPYCIDCINFRGDAALFRSEFEGTVEYEYAVMHDYDDGMFEEYGDENVTLASKYYLCAQKFSRLEEFRNCVEAKFARQVGVPLTRDELNACTTASNMTVEEMGECLPWAEERMVWDGKLAETYFGREEDPPKFVVDCRFSMGSPNLVKYAICYNYPETEGC